ASSVRRWWWANGRTSPTHSALRSSSRRRPACCCNVTSVTRKCRNNKESDDMAWLFLFIAGLLEVGWAIGLKYTEGFTRLVPTVLTVTAMILSIGMLGIALRTLPVGTAYAVWTGIGAVGTAMLGIYLFGDPATVMRLACIGLIVAGIVGLK